MSDSPLTDPPASEHLIETPGGHHRRPHALLRPATAIPFLLVGLIWGSTWFVIADQISLVAPSWSVTYRFGIATIAMALLAWRMEGSLKMGGSGHLMALVLGITQFCGNFNFVYRAEAHITSGVVAVMFGLLMVPNAMLGRIFLGVKVSGRFILGTLVAIAGVALLLAHEARLMPAGSSLLLGAALTFGGIMSASSANILQATRTAQAQKLLVLLAWAMGYGTLVDAGIALWVSGAPVFPAEPRFWAGVVYLALVGSVVTFPLYFKLIRELGPGRAAYNGVMVPVVAMLISTFFEGYAWSPLALGGVVLALIGMVIVLRGREVD